MIKLRMFVIFGMLCLASLAYGFAPAGNQPNQSVSVAYYDNDAAMPALLSDISTNNPVWQDFQERHGGNWWGQINTLTGQVHRAWGGSVYVGQPSDEAAAADLALSFLRSEQRLANVDLGNLSLISAQHHGHHWFVNFRQTLNGLEIYGSLVSIRISDAGNVVLFGCDSYPAVNISTIPTLSKQAAISSAMTGISLDSNDKTTEPQLVIFPIPGEEQFNYYLAYQMEVTTIQPGHWLVVVDANTGVLLYRRDLIYYYNDSGFINGRILPATPYDSLVTMPFVDERVILAVPETTYTDSVGFFNFDFPNQQPYRLTAILRGRFINVLNYQGLEAQYVDTLSPGDTVNILWDTNARRDERNCYYHTHVFHVFFKALDPSFTSLDFPLTCNVNINQTCNAYWDGSSINFFMAGGGCSNTGEIADVIYHEYGHGVTDYIYRPDAGPTGAMHEGWSDYTAAMITNQPLIGRGFTGPGSYLRTVDNNNHWPEDTTGEPHNDGLIISGALWDLRQAMGPRAAYADSMFHFARYARPHNFQDYLTDILIYDDDDDNIYNGTPHSDSIYSTFDRHGIGPGNHIFITHIPLEDTQNIDDPYVITATITSTISPLVTDSIMVYYKLQHSGEFLPAPMHSSGNPNEFFASIEPQPIGTLIEYYISASNESGLNVTSPETAPMPTYFFVVGSLTVQIADSLETDTGWIVGAPNDDARTGIWTRVDPVGTHRDNYPDVPYQPEDDHTPDPGVMCFITGQQPLGDTNNSLNDVDSGQTTVYSPSYNLAGYPNPVVQYWRWFANSTNLNDTLYVDISSDGGVNWTNLEMVQGMQNSWQKSRFLLSQFINQFSQVKLRFIAEDRPPNSIVEAGVDDITLFSLTTTGIHDNPPDRLPMTFALKGNYPNPFNGKTEISFSLPARGDVELSIYDISGRLVYSSLTPNMSAGNHSIIWNGCDLAGKDISSGVYLYKIQSGSFSSAKKMLMLK